MANPTGYERGHFRMRNLLRDASLGVGEILSLTRAAAWFLVVWTACLWGRCSTMDASFAACSFHRG